MTRYFILLAFMAVTAVASLYGASASAAPFERLVMPGPVIEGHAKYEEKCSECHRPFSKGTQKELCLDCHEKVAADVKEKKGYHGKSKEVSATECRHCHTEHKGRDFDVVLLDTAHFDHSSTDYELKESHLKAECSACHEKEKKYREAPGKCFDCHKEDDSHKEELGKKCDKCHKPGNWKKNDFDHDKTDFKLKDKHKDATCISCHPARKYEKTPKDCYSCHTLNDVHKGRYGKKCEDCHSVKEWDKTRFDHEKTDFSLKWKHKDVSCDKCHTGKDIYKEELPEDCFGCHKNDDAHRGRYGKKCEDCHSEKEWGKSKFDHDKTDFKLKDKHKDVECVSCHRGEVKDVTEPRRCYDCHRPEDAHKGQQGRDCGDCHNEKGWRHKVFFDHDLTKFPLIGLHAVAPCEQCHIGAVYKDTPTACMDCHEKDDDHKLSLGPECAECHNPNDWRLWTYDHDEKTDFDLDGAHKDLRCGSCHKKPAKKKVRQSQACSSCHTDDDEHRGGFGQVCDRCHTTKSFKEIEMRR